MSSVNDSIDANAKLKDIKEMKAHYDALVNQGHGHAPVTAAEMSVILGVVTELFTGVGIGVKRNAVGQALPQKKGWERHG